MQDENQQQPNQLVVQLAAETQDLLKNNPRLFLPKLLDEGAPPKFKTAILNLLSDVETKQPTGKRFTKQNPQDYREVDLVATIKKLVDLTCNRAILHHTMDSIEASGTEAITKAPQLAKIGTQIDSTEQQLVVCIDGLVNFVNEEASKFISTLEQQKQQKPASSTTNKKMMKLGKYEMQFGNVLKKYSPILIGLLAKANPNYQTHQDDVDDVDFSSLDIHQNDDEVFDPNDLVENIRTLSIPLMKLGVKVQNSMVETYDNDTSIDKMLDNAEIQANFRDKGIVLKLNLTKLKFLWPLHYQRKEWLVTTTTTTTTKTEEKQPPRKKENETAEGDGVEEKKEAAQHVE